MPTKSSKEVKTVLKPYNDEIKRHIAGLVKRSDEDIKRYTGALSEEFQGRVKGVAEQFSGLNGKIDTLQHTANKHTEKLDKLQATVDVHSEKIDTLQATVDSHTEMIGALMVDVSTIKANVEFLKGGLKKKVDYDEFLALERRLSLVESKV